jgi:RNA polymerase-binding transcription factor DksA
MSAQSKMTEMPRGSLAALRHQLEAERSTLHARLTTLDELEVPDDPMAATAIASQLRSALDAVDAALTEMEDGSYGRCVDCDGAIPMGRLQAMPQAVRCVGCQSRAERPTTA